MGVVPPAWVWEQQVVSQGLPAIPIVGGQTGTDPQLDC